MARLLTLCVLFLSIACGVSVETHMLDLFLNFIDDFGKPYKNNTYEFQRRFENFKDNLNQIEKLNQPYKEGHAVYGITKFSDLSQEEFKALYLSRLRSKSHDATLRFKSEMSSDLPLPTPPKTVPKNVDWRALGAVSPVKNQGQCGACWAFAATETIESAYAITYNTSVPELAVQQLIDCSRSEGNKGCEGGDLCTAVEYVQKFGITYESTYPLTNKDGICYFKPSDETVKLAKYDCKNLVDNENKILTLLATVGPVAVAVDATTWNNYVGGIIQFHCSAAINHAVEIVGYDLTGPVPYYIVRNSWGKDFGIDGFLYIKIGSNLCGIAEEVADVYLATV